MMLFSFISAYSDLHAVCFIIVGKNNFIVVVCKQVNLASVGQAPFCSRFEHRYTHQSGSMERLATGCALQRNRHLRIHPDLIIQGTTHIGIEGLRDTPRVIKLSRPNATHIITGINKNVFGCITGQV